jgi:uncharacterized repeat protein (TIGR01451 family)
MARRPIRRLGLAAATAFGVALAIYGLGSDASTVLSAQSGGPHPAPPGVTPGQGHVFHPRSWVSVGGSGSGASGSTIYTSTDNLPPGAGALLPGTVMHTTKVFLIFWSPNGTLAQSYKDLLTRFVNDLNGTPFLNIVTQYYDNDLLSRDYIKNVVTFGGVYTDSTTAYPHAGTGADPLQDGDIQSEVDHAIAVNGWPTGNGNFFAVFTEKGIESCNGTNNCTPLVPGGNQYCAYHNWFNLLDNRIYTNMPFVNSAGWDCNNTNGQPNSAIDGDADYEISTFSHELFEAITDPYPNLTWTDGSGPNGGEIGDKCAYVFPNAANADGSSLTLHGNPYNVQPEWSNGTMTALGGHAFDGCTYAYQPADMSITKAGPSSVYAGATFDYSVNVTSNTAPTSETPHFTDPLDSNLRFQAISTPSDWACTTPPVGSTGSIDCYKTNNAAGTDGSMENGDAASFAVTTKVASSTPNGATVGNTGTITWDGKYLPVNDTASNVHLSKSSSTSATVIASADLSIAKSTLGTAYAGLDLSYAVALENDGPSDAQNVVMTDSLPAGTTFVSAVAPTGFTCTSGASGPVTCTGATMGAGAIASITITVHIPSSASGTIANTATVSSSTSDPNPTNNSSSITVPVNTESDVSITKSGPSAPTAGTNVTYTIMAANGGPSDAQSVSMTDTVVAGTTFVSLTPAAGWTCTTPAVGATGTVTCTDATLAAGATAAFSLVVHLAPSAVSGSQLCDTANIATTTLDAAPGNNSAKACGTVQTSADLALAQAVITSGSPGKGVATFTLTVTNNGPSDSKNISLVANSSLFSGPPPSINASAGGTCTVSSSNVTCQWAGLAFGTNDSVTISVPWRSAVNQVCDSGTVSAGTPDPNATNNSVTTCASKK